MAAAGATRPALRRSRAYGQGSRLLAQGRSAGDGAFGNDGGGCPVAEGLDVLAGLPDGPRRRQQELDLQIALASALAATKGSVG
jgi:hypothetical protein